MSFLAKRRRLYHAQTPKSLYIWNLEQSLIFRENKAIVHSHDLQAKDFAVRDMRKVQAVGATDMDMIQGYRERQVFLERETSTALLVDNLKGLSIFDY